MKDFLTQMWDEADYAQRKRIMQAVLDLLPPPGDVATKRGGI